MNYITLSKMKNLAFLEDEAENIYTDDNLKVKF